MIDLDLSASNIQHYIAYSPLITLAPAWKIFFKVLAELMRPY